jgi:pimeloyl-ACP methyl ester carboxylesterase
MKTIFIIAGFDLHHTANDDYDELKDGLKANGYNVVPVDIGWRQTTPTQYTQKFIEAYEQHKTGYNIILGNSFGAVVALIAASKLNPDETYLCSLSPFFYEDRGKRPDSFGIKYFGKRRMEDLWSLHFDSIAADINKSSIRTTVIYGELENKTSPQLVDRCKDAAKKIQRSKIIEFPDTPHSMKDDRYMRELLKLL